MSADHIKVLRDWQMLGIMRQECERRYKTQRAAAKAIGVSAPFLSMMLAGKRDVPARIAKAFGYERQFVFIPLEYKR